MGLVVALAAVSFVFLIGSYFTGEDRQQQQSHRPNKSKQHRREDNHAPAGQRPRRATRRVLDGQADANQVNQSNPLYTSLRDRATHEGDAMARAFAASQLAYQSGERARAKELSNEGNTHKAEMERLNREASQWIFRENNKDSQPGDVDLHGLYVKEAVELTEKALAKAQRRGESDIQLIVGKGLHSQSGQAKIKPAIEELMRKYKLIVALDPNNAGVLIVQLKRGGAVDRARERGAFVLRAGDLSRKLDSRNDGCVIM